MMLVIQNRKARESRYHSGFGRTRQLSTKLMPLSGTILLLYIGTHLLDFTFTSSTTQNAVVNGEYLGLYGLVYNSFFKSN